MKPRCYRCLLMRHYHLLKTYALHITLLGPQVYPSHECPVHWDNETRSDFQYFILSCCTIDTSFTTMLESEILISWVKNFQVEYSGKFRPAILVWLMIVLTVQLSIFLAKWAKLTLGKKLFMQTRRLLKFVETCRPFTKYQHSSE